VSVPGDFGGATETITGRVNVNLLHLGAVFQSTGRVVLDNDALRAAARSGTS
jgi:hypothetical protein